MKHHLSHIEQVKGGKDHPMTEHHGDLHYHLTDEQDRHAHHMKYAKEMHHMGEYKDRKK